MLQQENLTHLNKILQVFSDICVTNVKINLVSSRLTNSNIFKIRTINFIYVPPELKKVPYHLILKSENLIVN